MGRGEKQTSVLTGLGRSECLSPESLRLLPSRAAACLSSERDRLATVNDYDQNNSQEEEEGYRRVA